MLGLSDLPPELLEVVFSCLPLQTLLGTCSLVCRDWWDIISQKKFLQWRKLYFKYKLQEDFDDEDGILELKHPKIIYKSAKAENDRNDPLQWLLDQSEEVYKYKTHLFSRITSHSRYEECVTHLTLSQMSRSNVSVVTWMILTSGDVWEVRNIVA